VMLSGKTRFWTGFYTIGVGRRYDELSG